MLKTSKDLGVSLSSASIVAVVTGLKINWSTSKTNVAMKAALGIWLGMAPLIRTGSQAYSV